MANIHTKFHENLSNHFIVIKYVQEGMAGDDHNTGSDIIQDIMRMCIGSWVMALPSYLKILSICHIVITG
jgi:hypothetical protein